MIPYGYCHCGCGRKTWVSDKTDRARGWVKDEPVFFCRGHKPKDYKGEKHHSWKGGNVAHNEGYRCIYRPDHPKSNHGYILEHVAVMEDFLGHYLPAGSIVHHKNRIRTDNRIDNLSLCRDHAEHRNIHVRENI